MLLYILSRKFADVKLAVEAMPITDNLSVAIIIADVAELVDALVLGTSANGVGVRVPSSAPKVDLLELVKSIAINEFEQYKKGISYHFKKSIYIGLFFCFFIKIP